MRASTLGGSAGDKSTVARALAAHGARVVDGDAAARDEVDPETPRGAALLPRIVMLRTDGALGEPLRQSAALWARLNAERLPR